MCVRVYINYTIYSTVSLFIELLHLVDYIDFEQKKIEFYNYYCISVQKKRFKGFIYCTLFTFCFSFFCICIIFLQLIPHMGGV